MRVTTLMFKEKGKLSFEDKMFDTESIGDIKKLVDSINNATNYCAIANPMTKVGSSGQSLLETLMKNGVNTDNLVSHEFTLSFQTNSKNEPHTYDTSFSYILTPNEAKQAKFIITVLISWVKTVSKNYTKVDYSDSNKLFNESYKTWENKKILEDKVSNISNNGFTARISTDSHTGLVINAAELEYFCRDNYITTLNNSKYYSIGIYMPHANIRYYTDETYAEMLAKHYEEKETLQILGEEIYIASTRHADGIRKQSPNKNRILIGDMRCIKECHGFEEYSIAIIDLINNIIDNKTSFIIHNSGFIQIAFKNEVPVIDALEKIINAIRNGLEEHIVYSLIVCTSNEIFRPWDVAFYGTCNFNLIKQEINNISKGLTGRVTKKSSNTETDIIALFNEVKQLGSE